MTRRIEVDPERRQRIGEAVAMVQGGSTIAAAARSTGTPESTVRWWVDRLSNDPEAMKTAEQRLAATYAAVAQAGMDRIANEIGDMDHSRLIAATGMASDKLARIRGWGTPQDTDHGSPSIAHALEAITRAGSTLTVTVTPPDPTIDITPTTDDKT